MNWKDAKYLLVWFIPATGLLGIHLGGWWSPGSFYIAFVLIPVLEFFLPISHINHDGSSKKVRRGLHYFDVLLCLNVPVLYIALIYFLNKISASELSIWESAGYLMNMGILLGVLGINVAHELGHRHTLWAQTAASLLLLPSLYLHFTSEHNHWHHRYVATLLDPSSAKKNETIYAFWWRSISGVFQKAWLLECRRLHTSECPAIHWKNRFILQQCFHLFYLAGIYQVFGFRSFAFALGAAIISVLLLESINYIEHYGLQRQASETNPWEPVGPAHSWNSDHALGRIFLYELTRHPDHHQHAAEKYQNLDSFKISPQLRFGYPSSIWLALLPPLWFQLMNPLLPNQAANSIN